MTCKLERLLAPHPRLRAVRPGLPAPQGRCVIYWMQRSQRGVDNPALNLAIVIGNSLEVPVLAVFGLTPSYPGAQRRHYRFLLDGLVDAASDLERRGVTLVVRLGRPDEVVTAVAREVRAGLVVGDENPVRVGKQWREALAGDLGVPFYLVDGDVVVPSSHFPKEEYAARTIRPKIHRVLEDYLKPLPNPVARVAWTGQPPSGVAIDPTTLMEQLKVGGSAEVPGYRGGSREALDRLRRFVRRTLAALRDRAEPPDPVFHQRALGPPALRAHQPPDDRDGRPGQRRPP